MEQSKERVAKMIFKERITLIITIAGTLLLEIFELPKIATLVALIGMSAVYMINVSKDEKD